MNSRFFLPLAWWKLSLLWLLNLKGRTPPAKRDALFANSLRASILGLSIGIAALSLTLSIVSGFQWVWARSVANALGYVVHFSSWRSDEQFKRMISLAPAGIERVEIFWTTQGLLVGPKGGRGVMVEGRRALDSNDGANTSPDPSSDHVKISLGRPLAKFLGVSEGDKIRLLMPGVLSGAVQAEVSSLLEYGMYDVDSRLAIVDDASLRTYLEQKDPERLAKRPGDGHGLRFVLDESFLDPADESRLAAWAKTYRQKIENDESFKEEHPTVRTWFEQKRNLFGSIGMDKKILSFVLSLLTLVATLNVAATLVVLFLERDREMAILQAIGLSRFQLLQWIALQGLFIGIFASALGLVFAKVGGYLLQQMPFAQLPAEIYNISALPLIFDLREQAYVFAFGIVASLGVAFILGFRLSRISLVSVLGFRR